MYKIAISGRANTGKNTLAHIIVEQLRARARAHALASDPSVKRPRPLSVKSMAFADPIKEMLQIMFPTLPEVCLYGPSALRKQVIPGAFKEGQPVTVRQALQDLGTGFGRAYDDKIWLKNFDHRVQTASKDIVIITDVRFPNEFYHLKETGFYQIRLYRDTGEPVMEHSSETLQSTLKDEEFDAVIFNDKTLAKLKKEVAEKILPNLKEV